MTPDNVQELYFNVFPIIKINKLNIIMHNDESEVEHKKGKYFS